MLQLELTIALQYAALPRECNQFHLTKMSALKNEFQLTFDPKFNIEDSPHCDADRLSIRLAGRFENYPRTSFVYESYDWLIACGSDVPEIRGMPGHQMELVFQTDGQTQHEGFQVHVETRKCGGVFDDTFGGYVASPNYPISNYPNDEYCFWLLLAPSGDVIAYEFFVFDLYGPTSAHPDCEHVDWLELYNGPRIFFRGHYWRI